MFRLTITLPIGSPSSLSSSIASTVSWIGKRLQQGDQVDGRQLGVQHLHHAFGLTVHRTALGQVGDGLGDVEEAGDPPGRRGVDHDGVVCRLLALLGPRDDLPDLAREQHVPQARRDRRRELDRTDAVHRPPGDAEVVEHVEVLQERGLGVDGQRVDLAAALGRRDLDLLVRQRRHVEELRDALAALDFDQQHLAAARGERQCQRRRDRRLSGAALAGHEVQAHLRQAGRPGHGVRPGGAEDWEATSAC